jgi:hypothetical protein
MNMSVFRSRLVALSPGRTILPLLSFPRVASAFAVLVGCVVLVGWTLNLDVLKSGLPGLVAMNPATALCFVASGLSLRLLDSGQVDRRAHSIGLVLARSHSGIMAVFTSDGPGGAMARAQLPVAIVVPIVLGWFRLKGQELRLYNTDAGVSLAAVYSIYLSVLLIWIGARALDRLEAERKRAERARIEAERSSVELEQRIDALGVTSEQEA